MPSSCMNCPHSDPSWPTSHVTDADGGGGGGGGGVGGKVVNCPHFNPSQPTSSTTVTGGGDAKFMHELSTLWPIMAYLPRDVTLMGGVGGGGEWGARLWTVHTLTHHSLPPAQQWQEEEMPSSCMNCPHSDPSWLTSHTTLTGGEPKFVNSPHMSCCPLLVSSWPSVVSAIFSLIITSSLPLAVAGISREVRSTHTKSMV